MSPETKLARANLVFFGAICRSVSHEMNNITAIQLELVGLMQDRLAMAERAPGLDQRNSGATLAKIEAQLNRATALMRLLNRLGHSVDEFDAVVNLAETARDAMNLCRRMADMKKVALSCHYQGDATFRGSKFLVLHALFRAIGASLGTAGPGTELVLLVGATDQSFRFELSGCESFTGPDARILETLVEAVGGTVLAPQPAFTFPRTFSMN